MQFIEVNSFEVNAAVHELARDSDSARIVLFPMVHVAEKAFYEDIAAQAAECDFIVFEGVRSRLLPQQVGPTACSHLAWDWCLKEISPCREFAESSFTAISTQTSSLLASLSFRGQRS